MESVFIITAVAGLTELVKRLRERDYWAAGTIVVAAVIGAVAGLLGIGGVTVETGIVAGLSASGLVTIAGRVGTR